MQIVLFTSIESCPHIAINPHVPMLCPTPIYLAFLHAGPGHYCLATPKQDTDEDGEGVTSTYRGSSTSMRSCRCGRGRNADKKDRLNCSKQTVYSSRCPCLKGESGCTSMCKCSNCNNPFGKRTDESAICEFKGTRKRARQPEQEMLRASGIKYMSRMGEQPHCGMWTAEEHYIILAIVEHVEIIKEPIDIASVTQLYQVIVGRIAYHYH